MWNWQENKGDRRQEKSKEIQEDLHWESIRFFDHTGIKACLRSCKSLLLFIARGWQDWKARIFCSFGCLPVETQRNNGNYLLHVLLSG
jgi:hypothetical protein